MPEKNLSEDYFERCISATNLYVETYNANMASEIQSGICLHLSKEFKRDRFKSMTGKEWLDEYDGQIRWEHIKQIPKPQEAINV